MTGETLDLAPATIEERSSEIAALQARYAKPKPIITARNGAAPSLEDRELLDKMFAAKNGAKVRRLFEGDTSDYKSPSEARMALVFALAFWTQDEAQIDRLIRSSGLDLTKWDRLGPSEIANALANLTGAYSPNGHSGAAPRAPDPEPAASGDDKPPPRVLHAERLDALLDREDLPLDAIITDGGEGAILTNDGKMVVAGATGVGKTNMLLRLARCLCAGEDWLGLGVPKPRRVLYLLLEGSPRATKKRLRKIWADAPAAARERFHIGHVPLDLSNEDCVLALRALLDDVRPGVLIIDPLRNAHPYDENSSQEMAKLTRMLDAIAHRHGLALALAHHDRKRPPFVRRDTGTDRLRGSTAFTGWLSAALSIDSDPSGADRITTEWIKTRDAEAPLERMALDFDRANIDFYPTERAPEGKVSDDAILTAVFGSGGSIRGTDLIRGFVEGAGVTDRWVRKRIRELVKAGTLEEYIADDDKRAGAKSYKIPAGTLFEVEE